MAPRSTLACAPALTATLAAIVNDPAVPLAGLAVLALRDGAISYQAEFGRRWMAPTDVSGRPVVAGEADLPLRADSLVRVASVSKMVTALGALSLVELGKLDLDVDIGRYLGYPVRNPRHPHAPITLRQLLSHTSTLSDEAGYFFKPELSLKDVLMPGAAHAQGAKAWLPQGEPGQWFSYANLNWTLIGTLMERVSGERFDRLMQRLVLQPLGIDGGYYPPEFSADEQARIATLYRKRSADEVWQPSGAWQVQKDDWRHAPEAASPALAGYVPGTNASLFSPTGGLRVSSDGLGRLLSGLLIKAERLPARHTPQWQYTPERPNGDSSEGLFQAWGLGVQRLLGRSGPQGGDRLDADAAFTGWGHFGEAYGAYSGVFYAPARGNALVYLVTGVGNDPQAQRGRWSSLHRFEERIADALVRCAIHGRAP